jgi:hypothetical protein
MRGESRPSGLIGVRARHAFAVEEFGGGAVRADPIAPPEQVMNFVGVDWLLERDVLGAQFSKSLLVLLEGHVAIVVATD